MATRTVNISFSKQSLKEIDEFAKREDMSRSDVLRVSAKKYIRNFSQWRSLQRFGTEKAKKLGLGSEEKIVKTLYK